MSNSEIVRALRRRISSIVDFLAITVMIIGAFFLILFVLVLFIDDNGDMTGIGNCGTTDCIDQ